MLSPLAAGKGASAEEEKADVPALLETIPIHADFVMAAGIIGEGKRFEWVVGGEDGKSKIRLDGREDSVLGEGDGAFVSSVQAGDVLGFESIGEEEAEVVILDSD
ncbi:hypothetical protein V499_07827 [Pseudogymnoascus sp. VKM F-103]|nr:hypothetical protein V499_07827 [Pseudogymnoascus sp. VKM F-103]